jgi:hypothetical protein
MLDEIRGAPGVHGAFDTWLKKQKEHSQTRGAEEDLL